MATGDVQGRDGEARVRVFEPIQISAAGNLPKRISEHVGRLASGDASVSVARMVSPPGWIEPPQTPEFDEFSVVLRGELHVLCAAGTRIVRAGQAVRVRRGTRVQYATPGVDGAEYLAVCLPAFSPDSVHREAP